MRINSINFIDNFYKMYRDNDYNFCAVFNQQLFLSNPSLFNDPFDGFIGLNKKEFEKEFMANNNISFVDERSIDAINKKLDYFSNLVSGKNISSDDLSSEKNRKIRERINEAYKKYCEKLKEILNDYFICCFTINKPEENMAMWSFYANDYKGFCVDFSFCKLLYDYGTERVDKYQEFLYKNIHKVKYTDTCISVNWKEILKIPFEELSSNYYITKLIKKALKQKNKQWRYEKEYRLILHKNELLKLTSIVPNSVLFLKNGCLINFPYTSKIYFNYDIVTDKTKKTLGDIARKLKIKKLFLNLSQSNKLLFIDDEKVDYENLDLLLGNFDNLKKFDDPLPF